MTDDDLIFGGVCPVCGDEFADGWDVVEEGESYPGSKVCIVERTTKASRI